VRAHSSAKARTKHPHSGTPPSSEAGITPCSPKAEHHPPKLLLVGAHPPAAAHAHQLLQQLLAGQPHTPGRPCRPSTPRKPPHAPHAHQCPSNPIRPPHAPHAHQRPSNPIRPPRVPQPHLVRSQCHQWRPCRGRTRRTCGRTPSSPCITHGGFVWSQERNVVRERKRGPGKIGLPPLHIAGGAPSPLVDEESRAPSHHCVKQAVCNLAGRGVQSPVRTCQRLQPATELCELPVGFCVTHHLPWQQTSHGACHTCP